MRTLPKSFNSRFCCGEVQIIDVDNNTDWARTNITINTHTKTNVGINLWSFGNMAKYSMFVFIIGY